MLNNSIVTRYPLLSSNVSLAPFPVPSSATAAAASATSSAQTFSHSSSLQRRSDNDSMKILEPNLQTQTHTRIQQLSHAASINSSLPASSALSSSSSSSSSLSASSANGVSGVSSVSALNGAASSSMNNRSTQLPSRSGMNWWYRLRLYFVHSLIEIINCFPVFLDNVIRYLGPVLIILVWALLAFYFYMYFVHLIPYAKLDLYSPFGVTSTLVGLFILFQLYYNHFWASFVRPGSIPNDWTVPENLEQLLADELPMVKRGERFSSYCRKCKKPKPPRAHHCHICNRCILKMDHHCPWIGGCVGFHNYRYFFLFLLWLTIGCVYICALCFPPLMYPNRDVPAAVRRSHENAVFFAAVLASTAFFAVGGMCAFHGYLIFTNQTTIELYFNRSLARKAQQRGQKYENPFDLGIRKNISAALGEGTYGWSFLCPPWRIFGLKIGVKIGEENDGLRYPMNPNAHANAFYPPHHEHAQLLPSSSQSNSNAATANGIDAV